MPSPRIKARDSAESVQEKLGLNAMQYENFRRYVLDAIKDFCKQNSSAKWLNLAQTFTGVPAHEKKQIIASAVRLCEEHKLYGDDLDRFDKPVFKDAIEWRMKGARQAWQQNERGKSATSAGDEQG